MRDGGSTLSLERMRIRLHIDTLPYERAFAKCGAGYTLRGVRAWQSKGTLRYRIDPLPVRSLPLVGPGRGRSTLLGAEPR